MPPKHRRSSPTSISPLIVAEAEASRLRVENDRLRSELDARSLERDNAVACQEDAESRLSNRQDTIDMLVERNTLLVKEVRRLGALADKLAALAIHGPVESDD